MCCINKTAQAGASTHRDCHFLLLDLFSGHMHVFHMALFFFRFVSTTKPHRLENGTERHRPYQPLISTFRSFPKSLLDATPALGSAGHIEICFLNANLKKTPKTTYTSA